MHELLIAAAKRAMRYLEGLNERDVAPDPPSLLVSQRLISRCLLIHPQRTKP